MHINFICFVRRVVIILYHSILSIYYITDFCEIETKYVDDSGSIMKSKEPLDRLHSNTSHKNN